MLLKRYHSLTYLESLDLDEALSLIEFAVEQTEEELLFQRWINGLQYQMSFQEFKLKLKPQPIKSDAEIIDDVKDILKLFEKG